MHSERPEILYGHSIIAGVILHRLCIFIVGDSEKHYCHSIITDNVFCVRSGWLLMTACILHSR